MLGTSIINFSHEMLSTSADVILIGEVNGKWFDFNPFNEIPFVDIVKITPEQWLRNEQYGLNEIEVRYSGGYSCLIPNIFGSSCSPQQEFIEGDRVLLFLYRDDTIHTGSGFYSYGNQGHYLLKDGMAENQNSEKNIPLNEFLAIIEKGSLSLVDPLSDYNLVRVPLDADLRELLRYSSNVSVNRTDRLSVDFIFHGDRARGADQEPYIKLLVFMNDEGLPEDYKMECWDGKKTDIFLGENNIESSLEKGNCDLNNYRDKFSP